MKQKNHSQIKWYETLTFKMALLAFMGIMFLVPLELIKTMIRERAENSKFVQEQISEEWGKEQTITGPVLNIPVSRITYLKNNEAYQENLLWHILPEELNISGEVSPQIRYKGIYESVIYKANLQLSGYFNIPEEEDDPSFIIRWDEAYYTLGISDNRGIMDSINMLICNNNIPAEPGALDMDIFRSGVTFPDHVSPGQEKCKFLINMGVRGSSGLYFSPTGKSTTVKIKSPWTTPSFTGNYLPVEREIDDQGFRAGWSVTHLNRNFPQTWFGDIHTPSDESFGLNMILEIDHYRKSERSAKYGLLFIAFTYLVLLFLELSANSKIHLFHYFLVSLSLVLFFSLLNSLSEHIGFSAAYLVSSAATISLLSVFSGSLLKRRKYIFIISGLLTILYIFLYVILALNEFAYLAGNIGLFIGLAVLMWLSSRINLFRKSGI